MRRVTCQYCRDRHLRCSGAANAARPRGCTACADRSIPCVPSLTRGSRKQSNFVPNTGPTLFPSAGPSSTTPGIVKILIGLDAGTAYCKSVYRVFRGIDNMQPQMCVDRMIANFEQIEWDHGKVNVPTQLAYRSSGDSDNGYFDQLWGIQVTDALKNDVINGGDMINNLKLLIFNDIENNIGQQHERRRVRKYMTDLRRRGRLPPLPMDITKIEDDSVHEFLGLYSDFLRRAYRYVLYKIQDAHPEVDFDQAFIEVAIPLPVRCDPAEVQLVLSAVRAADIPNPYIVGEPTAALAHHFQLAFERSGSLPEADCSLILDIGGGSADLQGWANLGTSPFRVQERCPGDTKWCGGSAVNKTCVELVMRELRDRDSLWRRATVNGRPMTDQDIRRAVEESFEEAKKRFRGTDSVILRIEGLPNLENSRLRGGGKVVLNPDDMREIFNPSITLQKDMIRKALEELTHRYTAEGLPLPHVDLLIVGGGSTSPYVTDQLKNFCRETGQELFGRPILPRRPNDMSAQGSTTVAFGSLLLLTDKAFITKRIITRGYCVAWDNEVAALKGKVDPTQPIERSPHDGVDEALKVSKFFIRPMECLPLQHECCHQGWRGLFLDEVGDNGRWDFLEHLFWTDSVCDDNVWVYKPGVDIHPMPGPLKFFIPVAWSEKWKRRTSPKPQSRVYFYVEYRVRLVLDGMNMAFELIVPREGTFPKGKKAGRSHQYEVQRGEFDINGVFQLFNSVVDQ